MQIFSNFEFTATKITTYHKNNLHNAAKNKNIILYRDSHMCYMQISINVM